MLALLFLLRTAAAQDCDLLAADLPDPGAAATLAATVGFGAGHVYAGRPTGLLFAVPDVAGVGMLVAGFAKASTAANSTDLADAADAAKLAATLTKVGTGVLFGSRLVQTPSAVAAAHSRRREMVEACRSGTWVPPDGYGSTYKSDGYAPKNESVPTRPAPTRSDIVVLTSVKVLEALGLSALDVVQMKLVKPWVADLLGQGLMPGEIIQKAKNGEAPVPPATLPEPASPAP